jgi:hypothetical protein
LWHSFSIYNGVLAVENCLAGFTPRNAVSAARNAVGRLREDAFISFLIVIERSEVSCDFSVGDLACRVIDELLNVVMEHISLLFEVI